MMLTRMVKPHRWFRAVLAPFERFAQPERLGSVLLLAAMIVAILWANSPWRGAYFGLWEAKLTVGSLAMSLQHWINDALMVVFFLLVGLEIKRELLIGELSTAKQASLPLIAALGGMLVPALLYVSLNTGQETLRGWGIPMATDIAFALGVLQLMGPRCPIGLKVFLTALAIIDDLGAIGVIALFYTDSLAGPALLLSLAVLLALVVLNRLRVRWLAPYLVLGAMLWFAVLRSGIHATIAGVLLALTIPAGTRTAAATGEEQQSPLIRLERSLASVVPYVILPLFALANAGVDIAGARAPWASRVGLGVFLGLFLGKPIGITLFSWIAVKRGWAVLPSGVGWKSLHGAAWLGGIGFTMALFIASLAFEGAPRLDEAKLSVLFASAFAAIVGRYLVLRTYRAVADSRPLPADG